jgi:hypothetical protein
MPDPEPMTPRTSKVPEIDMLGVLLAHSAEIERLAHALTSLDAEIGRLTETVNRQDAQITTLISDNKHLAAQIVGIGGKLRNRIAALESPTDLDTRTDGMKGETVTMPRSLADALHEYVVNVHSGGGYSTLQQLARVVREYDAWKAGQGND